MERGLRREDTHGSFRRYLDYLYHYNRSANNIRVWAEKVYIFSDNSLVTVLNLPPRYRNAANNIQRSKENGRQQSAVSDGSDEI